MDDADLLRQAGSAGMHTPRLFTASVPVLLRYLETLSQVLDAVRAHGSVPAAELLAARLTEDMMPLARQVETACHLALRTALPLAGRPVPAFEPSDRTLQGLQAAVRRVVDSVAQLRPDDFAGAEQRVITETAGEAPLALPAWTFLCEFALPNFLFHVSMAYAIARSRGCRLGKAQFDGWHVYGAALAASRPAEA